LKNTLNKQQEYKSKIGKVVSIEKSNIILVFSFVVLLAVFIATPFQYISSEEAVNIALNHFTEHLENASNIKVTRLLLKEDNIQIDSKYDGVNIVIWRVDLYGEGYEGNLPVWVGIAYRINAKTGELIEWSSAGAGLG
jgi:hypothetical protein